MHENKSATRSDTGTVYDSLGKEQIWHGLHLPSRAVNALKNAEIESVEQLKSMSRKDILESAHIGQKTYERIMLALGVTHENDLPSDDDVAWKHLRLTLWANVKRPEAVKRHDCKRILNLIGIGSIEAGIVEAV